MPAGGLESGSAGKPSSEMKALRQRPRMDLSENVQMYLVTIYRLTEEGGKARTKDVATSWSVSPSSATEMIQKLAEMGYVDHEPYRGVSLTESGLAIGRAIARKRRLAETFLTKILGMRGPRVTEAACSMEHAIPDEFEAWMCHELGHPSENPTGESIPAGACCPPVHRVINQRA